MSAIGIVFTCQECGETNVAPRSAILPCELECSHCGRMQDVDPPGLPTDPAEAAPGTAPAPKRISLGWKLAVTMIVGLLSALAMLSGIASTGMNYRSMRAIETIAEKCK